MEVLNYGEHVSHGERNGHVISRPKGQRSRSLGLTLARRPSNDLQTW